MAKLDSCSQPPSQSLPVRSSSLPYPFRSLPFPLPLLAAHFALCQHPSTTPSLPTASLRGLGFGDSLTVRMAFNISDDSTLGAPLPAIAQDSSSTAPSLTGVVWVTPVAVGMAVSVALCSAFGVWRRKPAQPQQAANDPCRPTIHSPILRSPTPRSPIRPFLHPLAPTPAQEVGQRPHTKPPRVALLATHATAAEAPQVRAEVDGRHCLANEANGANEGRRGDSFCWKFTSGPGAIDGDVQLSGAEVYRGSDLPRDRLAMTQSGKRGGSPPRVEGKHPERSCTACHLSSPSQQQKVSTPPAMSLQVRTARWLQPPPAPPPTRRSVIAPLVPGCASRGKPPAGQVACCPPQKGSAAAVVHVPQGEIGYFGGTSRSLAVRDRPLQLQHSTGDKQSSMRKPPAPFRSDTPPSICTTHQQSTREAMARRHRERVVDRTRAMHQRFATTSTDSCSLGFAGGTRSRRSTSRRRGTTYV